jgi:hypothetical protein
MIYPPINWTELEMVLIYPPINCTSLRGAIEKVHIKE